MINYKTPLGHQIITAFIDASATIGEASIIWHFARVLAGVRIGDHVSIGGGTEIGRGSVIGHHSRIGANVFLPPHSQIGERVFIGPNVACADDRYPRVGNADYDAEPPIIEDDAVIGLGAVLLPGVRIGRAANVAAGTTVTKDVPAGATVCGPQGQLRATPAKWLRRTA